MRGFGNDRSYADSPITYGDSVEIKGNARIISARGLIGIVAEVRGSIYEVYLAELDGSYEFDASEVKKQYT